MSDSPLHQSAIGQSDAVLPEDVGDSEGDAHLSGHITQLRVELLELLGKKPNMGRGGGTNKDKGVFVYEIIVSAIGLRFIVATLEWTAF